MVPGQPLAARPPAPDLEAQLRVARVVGVLFLQNPQRRLIAQSLLHTGPPTLAQLVGIDRNDHRINKLIKKRQRDD